MLEKKKKTYLLPIHPINTLKWKAGGLLGGSPVVAKLEISNLLSYFQQ